jgi:hypothetical protein
VPRTATPEQDRWRSWGRMRSARLGLPASSGSCPHEMRWIGLPPGTSRLRTPSRRAGSGSGRVVPTPAARGRRVHPLLLRGPDHDPLRDVLEVLELDAPTANGGGRARSMPGQIRFSPPIIAHGLFTPGPPGPRLPVSSSRVFRSLPRSMELCQVETCQVVPVRDMCGRPVTGRSRCPDGGAATAHQPRPPSSPVSRREPSNVLWLPAGNPSNPGWLVGVVRGVDRRGARRT